MNCGELYIPQENQEQGYSIGWNLDALIKKGLPNQQPPNSLEELLKQITKLVSNSKSEWIGPQSINCLDSYIAVYVEKENLEYKIINELFLDFFQKINEKKIKLTFTLDLGYNKNYRKMHRDTYDLINRVLQNIILNYMKKGVFEPYFVINLYPETDWRKDILDSWLALSFKYGQPVYHNYITGTIKPETLKPMEKNLELENIYLRVGGTNGNRENQTVTGYACINLHKIATKAYNENYFLELIDKKIIDASTLLVKKQRSILDKFNKNKMPLTKWINGNICWSYSIISLVGMNEALEKIINAPISHIAGKAVTYKILERLLRKIEHLQIETGQLFSLESYPSDIPSAILLEEYEANTEFLTTGTELKPSHGSDLWDFLEHQKKYHSMYTGGTLQQIHLREGLSYNRGLKLLINRIIHTFGYNYLAITPVFSLCDSHNYLFGAVKKCPYCGNQTEIYTRIDTKIKSLSSLPIPLKEAFRQRVYHDIKNE
jgi:ribonucleoside-triphosphate reductase